MCLNLACVLIQPGYAITAGGKRFLFELPYGCGLAVVSKNGGEIKPPRENHPFWQAVELWIEQRMRMTLSGECVWVPKPLAKTEHIGGRNYRPLESVKWSAEQERYIVRRLETTDA